MADWVSPEDVLADWIGEDAPTDVDALGRWIRRAERMLRREFPSLTDRLKTPGNEPDLLETVRDVVSAMVTRVFRNPQGIRQMQETTGQFTASMTFAGDNPGGLYLTDSERDALRPPDSAKTGQAFSVGVGAGSAGYHLPWCDVMFANRPCSCGATLTGGEPIYELG